MTPEAILTAGVPAIIAVVVWLVRLEGRVNTNEAMQKQTAEDVKYIRSRIDHALNGAVEPR